MTQAEGQLQVPPLHQALLQHVEVIGEHGFGKTLAPHDPLDRIDQVGADFGRGQRAVRDQRAREQRWVGTGAHRRFERFGERGKVPLAQRQAGGHRMAAEALDQLGRGLGDAIQRVAQMHAFD